MAHKTAQVNEIYLDKITREIIVKIDGSASIYVEESNGTRFPQLMNSGPLIEGINYVLEFSFNAVNAMKGNKEFMELAEENRELRNHIKCSKLAQRVRQFLSALEYEKLTDFQAKCVLLLEREL